MFYAICYMFLLLFIRRPFHVNYFSSSFCYHKQDCHLHTTYIHLCSLVQCTSHITVLPHPPRVSAEKGEGNSHWSRAECHTKLFINTGLRVNKETRDIPNLINSESFLKEEAQGIHLPVSSMGFSVLIFPQPSSPLWYHHLLCPLHFPCCGPINFLWTTCAELRFWFI